MRHVWGKSINPPPPKVHLNASDRQKNARNTEGKAASMEREAELTFQIEDPWSESVAPNQQVGNWSG